MAKKKKNENSINHLLHLCKISDSNLVTDCIIQNKINFGRILNSKLEYSSFIRILKLLVQVSNAELESSRNEVLRMTLCKGFLNNMQNYLSQQQEVHIFQLDELNLIVLYFDAIVNILPLSEEFYKTFIDLMELLLNALNHVHHYNFSIRYWILDLILLLRNKITHINRLNRTYKDLNIFPDPVDLFEECELEPKKPTYRFDSAEEYLDMQFKLLKMDYENVVKEGIWQLKRELRGASKEPNSLINVYRNVTVDSVEANNNCKHSILHVITFSDNDEGKLNNREQSSDNKNFMTGSLLYFSSYSQFTTFVTARVIDGNDTTVDGNGDERKAIRVSVIGNPLSLQIGKKYLMIEPTIFFEPYFQVLNGIKQIKPAEFWLKKYISDLDFTSCPPNYLKSNSFYKIGSENVNILDTNAWPTINLKLNDSQLIALKAALSNEFTLIQGPPGTGKTHLVKAIITTLIENKVFRTAPVFLICSRNDSLDRVLEALVKKSFKVVRLGGQTKSEIIKVCELSKMNMKLTNKRKLMNKIKTLKKELAHQIANEDNKNIKQSSLENHISYFINLCESDAANGILSANVDVIGATTTGAAKFHNLMSMVKPEVVLIEEAAEVLEAHVVASIPQGCKHVILVGDHKQIQPNPAHIDSAEKYNMHISLFERLINNGMKCYTLTEQYRMRPEIASLISPLIYKTLVNHRKVQNYPNIKGISKNVFFINHTHPETRTIELFGRWNKQEGDFLLALANYLVLQGYSPANITILTGYSAQVAYINQAKVDFPALENLMITTIDNFQGEENHIILLSLVRSESSTIGFLRKSFRVNVALSRAKQGLYITGNMKTLSSQSSLWQYIRVVLQQQESIGDQLPLECQTHKTISYVRTPGELIKKCGGCHLRCGLKLNCGHLCKRYCHPSTEEHTNYVCKEQCLRLPCGEHRCKALCYENCKPCSETVERELPCGHTLKLKCQSKISGIVCKNPCNRMPCGKHKCKLLCYEECNICSEIVELKLNCGHTVNASCSVNSSTITCREPCNRVCANGHRCEKLCYEDCSICLIPITTIFCWCLKSTKPCYKVKSSRGTSRQN